MFRYTHIRFIAYTTQYLCIYDDSVYYKYSMLFIGRHCMVQKYMVHTYISIEHCIAFNESMNESFVVTENKFSIYRNLNDILNERNQLRK